MSSSLPLGSQMIGTQVAKYVHDMINQQSIYIMLDCWGEHERATHCMYFYMTGVHLIIPLRVIESKNKEYAIGDLVVGDYGWRTHTITDGKPLPGFTFGVRKIDPTIPVSPSTALGILGMTG